MENGGRRKKLSKRGELTEVQKLIIDNYYINGHKGREAVLTVLPDKTVQQADAMWYRLGKNPAAVQYREEHRARQKALTEVEESYLLQKLKDILESDVTDYLTNDVNELKKLPKTVRQLVKKVHINEKETTDIHGNTHLTRQINIELYSKEKALEMVAKHLDFYKKNNASKSKKTLNLNNVSIDNLNQIILNNT